MAHVPFRLADVFAERPLAGNQLCVVPDPGPLDAATMQALAREIGFSETTFVTETGADRYRMRIFTPDSELPFAGHPTLGTAFVLAAEGRTRTRVTQETAGGTVEVDVDLAGHFARMRQMAPSWGDEVGDRATRQHLAGTRWRRGLRGRRGDVPAGRRGAPEGTPRTTAKPSTRSR